MIIGRAMKPAILIASFVIYLDMPTFYDRHD